MDLLREIHRYIPYTECGLSQKAREALGGTHSTDRVWAVSEGERPSTVF